MKVIKIAGRLLLLVILLAVLYLGGIILYGTITEYKPEPGSVERIATSQAPAAVQTDSIIRLLNWNIGFGGLGSEMDFFYDGGKMVRADRSVWDKDMQGILQTMTGQPADLYLLQEVDRQSKRSYYVSQYDSISNMLSDYQHAFAVNYQVGHVPLPFTNPLGKVYSGLASYSRFPSASTERHQYPGAFPWPTRIFFLDRCFMSMRIPLINGKELIAINTHNSAYDETGELKKQEMLMLQEYSVQEYEKGNYVIIGGDFNQCPPDFNPMQFQEGSYEGFVPPATPADYIANGWIVAYDPTVPTNRHLDAPLDEHTFKTIIDYYILSPNVEVVKVKTLDLNFAFSDHQPVYLEVRLQ